MMIGIDLGTTYSLSSIMTPDGPRLIPNVLGEFLTPSAVGIDLEDHVLVGRSARELNVLHPDRCALAFKRHMGTDWTFQLAGRRLGAIELSSLVLKGLKADAEAFVGSAVDSAVITVPAYFNENQRMATIRAGQLAGLQVPRILNEPTAAAIAYGLHESADDKVMVVFDLGGGTFDVSIMDRFEGALEIRATAGEVFLGGEDFTNTLVSRVLESLGMVYERAELEMPRMLSRLHWECEKAKRKLSSAEEVEIAVPDQEGSLGESARSVTVRREQFEKWTEHILARAELPLRRALGDAGLKREQVDEVILVGGATRMPAVRRQVARLFGKEPRCRLNPDEVVSLGAAIQAGLMTRDASLDDLVVTDVAPFSLGIEISKSIGGQPCPGYFLPIINRNTTIPVSRVERVGTVAPNQTELRLRLYQGERRRVEENLLLAEFSVDGIPRGPSREVVDVRFTYDINGVLEIEATIVETSRKVTHVVTRYVKGLSESEIARAIRDMERLKTHPRDEAPNQLLLRWADRVYEELSVAQRARLELLIHGFEEALALQDPKAIQSNGDALRTFLERHADGGDQWQDSTDDFYG